MSLAQQLIDVKSLVFPVVKLKIYPLNTGLKVTRDLIQIGDNYIIRKGDTILDCFELNNPNQLETSAVYMSLQEFIIDNYQHVRKRLIIDSNFRLYSLNFCIEGKLFTKRLKKSNGSYHIFNNVPYYLEEAIPNKDNKLFGIIAYLSNIYIHIGWTNKEIFKNIRI